LYFHHHRFPTSCFKATQIFTDLTSDRDSFRLGKGWAGRGREEQRGDRIMVKPEAEATVSICSHAEPRKSILMSP